jgi:hypothetical protein
MTPQAARYGGTARTIVLRTYLLLGRTGPSNRTGRL